MTSGFKESLFRLNRLDLEYKTLWCIRRFYTLFLEENGRGWGSRLFQRLAELASKKPRNWTIGYFTPHCPLPSRISIHFILSENTNFTPWSFDSSRDTPPSLLFRERLSTWARFFISEVCDKSIRIWSLGKSLNQKQLEKNDRYNL